MKQKEEGKREREKGVEQRKVRTIVHGAASRLLSIFLVIPYGVILVLIWRAMLLQVMM